MTQSATETPWSERLALSVAQEVRRHRQRLGVSAQQLSERCAELGMPIQRSVLANMESGRRSTVTVAEVLILAAALDVAPAQLVFPVGYEETCEALPNRTLEPIDAVDWFAGNAPSRGLPRSTGAKPVWVLRQYRDLLAEIRFHISALEQTRERIAALTDEGKEKEKSKAAVEEKLHSVEAGDATVDPSWVELGKVFLDGLQRSERELERALVREREFIERHEHTLMRQGKEIAAVRRRITEEGWALPYLPKDIEPYVLPWNDVESWVVPWPENLDSSHE
ncbi:helix-turn-helix transcriptional regulator [Streptomyces nogalater]|uniref:Helix-turn-helix domain-containing protein n=1 Tax=Streptomyces nogalater TaxID=38314 RepID=A0ABW0WA01_STRNO